MGTGPLHWRLCLPIHAGQRYQWSQYKKPEECTAGRNEDMWPRTDPVGSRRSGFRWPPPSRPDDYMRRRIYILFSRRPPPGRVTRHFAREVPRTEAAGSNFFQKIADGLWVDGRRICQRRAPLPHDKAFTGARTLGSSALDNQRKRVGGSGWRLTPL